MSQVLDVLSRMRLFAGLSDEELAVLEKLVFVNRVPAGEPVCREGDRSDFVCFVVRGCLDIVKNSEAGGEVVIAHLRPGDSMGEMALAVVSSRPCAPGPALAVACVSLVAMVS